MENINKVIDQIFQNKLVSSIIVIVISFIIYRVVHKLITKSSKDSKLNKMSKKSRTYLRLMTSILRYIFILVTLLIVLQINGINVSSMLAGVGILSVVIGLAVQDALKDIIRGFSILSDDYFSVGDVIKYKDITAKVLVLGIKTTKVQDVATGNIISIANRNIEQVEVVSHDIYINVPMPYEVNLEKAEKVMNDIVTSISDMQNVDNCRYLGVNDLADSSIKYLLVVNCMPDLKLQTRRDSLKVVLEQLANNNIEVPYNQLDIHSK